MNRALVELGRRGSLREKPNNIMRTCIPGAQSEPGDDKLPDKL